MAVASPSGAVVMKLAVRSAGGETDGRLVYSVAFHGKPVMDDSALGLDLEGAAMLGGRVHMTKSESGKGVDEYSLTTGKTSKVHDEYNSLTVEVSETGAGGRKMSIEARAYEGGVAFRYVLPTQPLALKEVRLRQEATQFQFSMDAVTWGLQLPNYRSSYESEYVKLTASAYSNQGGVSSHFLLGLPLLAHEPGTAWVGIMEADLEGNAGMYLTNPSGNWEGHGLTALLAPQFEHPEVAVTGWVPYHSAWRVVMVADDPGRLVESNLLTDLSPPNAIKDASWVKAGKASWDWWNGDQDAGQAGVHDGEHEAVYRLCGGGGAALLHAGCGVESV